MCGGDTKELLSRDGDFRDPRNGSSFRIKAVPRTSRAWTNKQQRCLWQPPAFPKSQPSPSQARGASHPPGSQMWPHDKLASGRGVQGPKLSLGAPLAGGIKT